MPGRLQKCIFVLLSAGIIAAANRTDVSKLPRTAGGKPDLNGIWQTISTANWDIQDHGAQAGPFFQLGAIGAVPPGQGIVEGNEIPY